MPLTSMQERAGEEFTDIDVYGVCVAPMSLMMGIAVPDS